MGLSNLAQVRLRIPDSGSPPMFSDEELQFLLSENGGNPLLAAAEALDIVAGDPARLSQWRRGGVSVSRTAAADIRARAAQLRAQAAGSSGGIIVGTIKRSDFWGEC